MLIQVLTFDTLDSTNTEALRQARLGADEGLCIVADRQTAGRGRHGRIWVSESGAGLYFSIILRPNLETRFLPLITLMAGVAVHETLSELGLLPDIKWVNDVLVNEKKISGILAETAETSKGLAVVVGIGVNIISSDFPDDIAGSATSITDGLDADPFSKDQLVAILTKHLKSFYAVLQSDTGPPDILEEWRRRSTYYSGKSVRVVLESDTLFGTTDGLETNGALRVKRPDGTVAVIQAGDVERLRPAN